MMNELSETEEAIQEIKKEAIQEIEEEEAIQETREEEEKLLLEAIEEALQEVEQEQAIQETKNEVIQENKEEAIQESEKEGILLVLSVPQITEDAIIQLLISPTGEISVPPDASEFRVVEEIKNSILDGNMDPALKLVDEHYPKLIEAKNPVPFAVYALRYQNLIEQVRKKVENRRVYAEKLKAIFPIDQPRFREEAWMLSRLLEYEDPLNSPYKQLLDLSRRQQTAAIVLNQIASIGFDDKQEKQVMEKIRSSLLSGDISLATALINWHYYELIRDPTQAPKMLFYLGFQHVIELVRCKRKEQARRLAATSLSIIANRHPWLFDRVHRIVALVNCEEPKESPHKDLLDLYQRRLTVGLVLGEFPK